MSSPIPLFQVLRGYSPKIPIHFAISRGYNSIYNWQVFRAINSWKEKRQVPLFHTPRSQDQLNVLQISNVVIVPSVSSNIPFFELEHEMVNIRGITRATREM